MKATSNYYNFSFFHFAVGDCLHDDLHNDKMLCNIMRVIRWQLF